MSQKTSIVLTDAEGTPVNRTFLPARRDGDIYHYHNRASGIVAAYDVLTLRHRPPSKTSKATVITHKLVTPVLEQTSPSTSTGIQPAPTLAYSLTGELTFVLPARSSKQERKNLLAMMRDLIDETLMAENVEDYDQTYF